MRDEKILIILDDVADPEFLYEMWKVSQDCKHVKYLVTSQKSDLCWRVASDSWPIEMGEPTMEEARKIVASLVGLEHKTIPPELKEVADAMIEATGRNPLALACLISKFTKGGHRTDRKAWVEALQRLNELLGGQENIGVYGLSHASRGVWAAIELCLKSVESAEARDILSLMYACKGDSIPEEVLSIWYHRVPTTSTIFSFSMDELSTRELLKSVPGTWNEMRTWSLRPLLKLYMDRDMIPKEKMGPLLAALIGDHQQEKKSRFGNWLGGNRAGPDAGVKKERLRLGSDSEEVESEQTKVATVLCALYFDPAHTNKVVTDVANRARSLIKDPNDPINDLRRKAIEPIIWLMDKSEEKDGTWTKAHISCARQVFLKYVCEQQFDDKSICVLLELTSCPLASLAILTALGYIFKIEKEFLLIGDQLRFLTLIVEILGSNEWVERRIQEVASGALFEITAKADRENALPRVTSIPRILPVLVGFIQNSISNRSQLFDHALAQIAASILWAMSWGMRESMRGEDPICSKFWNEYGALASLASALSKDSDPLLREYSAGVFQSLAYGGETIKSQIISQNGALAGLVTALSEDENPNLQRYARMALNSLIGGGEIIQSQIVSKDGALAGLMTALSKDENPKSQEYALLYLRDLAAGGETIKSQIVSKDGVLAGLVTALSNDENAKLQQGAAITLRNLAAGGETTRFRIVSNDDALAGLVTALSKGENPILQEYTALTLSYLACGGETIKSRIVGENGALEGLVTALSEDENPKLQECAAMTLRSLVAGGDTIKSQIVSKDRGIAGLVTTVFKDEKAKLQECAGMTLLNLAFKIETIKSQIVSKDGALAGLVTALSKDEYPKLQEYAARALNSLACEGATMKSRIVGEVGALVGLVTALSNEENAALQEYGTNALANLAVVGETIMSRMSEDGELAGLVISLSTDENPKLQECSAMVLNGLAAKIETIRSRIVSEGRAFARLVTALSRNENPALQEYSAMAISTLVTGVETTRSRIVSEDGALAGLVTALSNDENLALQEYAAKALCGLAVGGETSESRIVSKDGALAGLVMALSKDANPALQKHAARALTNLAARGEKIMSLIVNEVRALADLVTALSKDCKTDLQIFAVAALSFLASRGHGIQIQLLEDRTVASLVKLVSVHTYPEVLQQWAFKTLQNLARGDSTIQSKLFAALKCLQNDHKLGVLAAMILERLKTSNEDLSYKV